MNIAVIDPLIAVRGAPLTVSLVLAVGTAENYTPRTDLQSWTGTVTMIAGQSGMPLWEGSATLGSAGEVSFTVPGSITENWDISTKEPFTAHFFGLWGLTLRQGLLLERPVGGEIHLVRGVGE